MVSYVRTTVGIGGEGGNMSWPGVPAHFSPLLLVKFMNHLVPNILGLSGQFTTTKKPYQ